MLIINWRFQLTPTLSSPGAIATRTGPNQSVYRKPSAIHDRNGTGINARPLWHSHIDQNPERCQYAAPGRRIRQVCDAVSYSLSLSPLSLPSLSPLSPLSLQLSLH